MLGTLPSKAAWILPVLCLAAAPVFAQSQSSGSGQQSGDPVADAARKAREAKQAAAKPRKVYTEDDLPKAPRSDDQPAATGSAPDAQAAAGAGVAPGDTPPAKSDEETWKAKFKSQRDKIARAEKELDILQRETEKAQLQYYPDPQKALSEQNSRKDINDKDAKIAAKRKEIDALKQGLTDLEDQLRKSGGDSGWARE
jgi:hypothetical protein